MRGGWCVVVSEVTNLSDQESEFVTDVDLELLDGRCCFVNRP